PSNPPSLLLSLPHPPPPRTPTPFPYTTLFRSEFFLRQLITAASFLKTDGSATHRSDNRGLAPCDPALCTRGRQQSAGSHGARPRDRKSTRLNSSHVAISYAVFCLKKKTRIYGH